MLRTRRVAAFIFSFCAGILLGLSADGVFSALIFAILGVLCAIFAAAHRFLSRNTAFAAIAAGLALAGMFYVRAYGAVGFKSADEFHGKSDSVTATVKSIRRYTDEAGVVIQIQNSAAGLPAGTRVSLYCDLDASVDEGDVITAELGYYKHNNNSLFGDFVLLSASGKITSFADGGNLLERFRHSVGSLVKRLYEGQPKDVEQVALAMAGGGSAAIDRSVSAIYRNAGVSHLLVVSGLHISILVMTLSSLLALLNTPVRFRGAVCLVFTALLAIFFGLSPSVLRAAFMLCVMSGSELVFRRHDPLTSLFCSLGVIALFNPFLLYSLSTLLSFASCFGIIACRQTIHRLFGRIKRKRLRVIVAFALSPMLFSLAASVCTLPVLILRLGSFSWISPFVNMLVTSLFGYIIIIELISVVLFAIIGTGGQVIGFISGNAYHGIYLFLREIYGAGIGSISTDLPYMSVTMLFSLAAVACLLLLEGKAMRIGLISTASATVISAAVCVLVFALVNRGTGFVYVEDSPSGRAVFACCDGRGAYIDLGGGFSPKAAIANGYTVVDDYVMTEISDDSLRALDSAAAVINIRKICLPDKPCDAEELALITELASAYRCTLEFYTDIYADGFAGMTVTSEVFSEGAEVVVERGGNTVLIVSGSTDELEPSDVLVLLGDTKLSENADLYTAGAVAACKDIDDAEFEGKTVSWQNRDGVRIKLSQKCEVTVIEH